MSLRHFAGLVSVVAHIRIRRKHSPSAAARANRAAADHLAVASACRRADRSRHGYPASDPADCHQGIQSTLEHGISSGRRILVTERPGRLRIVRNGVLDPNADCRRASGARARPGRSDGHCAASTLQ